MNETPPCGLTPTSHDEESAGGGAPPNVSGALADTAAEIFRLWSAGWPFIHLETLEEARALRIAELAEHHGSHVRALGPGSHVVMLASLFTHELDEDSLDQAESASILKAVRAFASTRSPGILVLRDVGSSLGDPRLSRRLRDLASTISLNQQCLLFIEGPFDPPSNLTEDFAKVVLPPPSADELRSVLDESGAHFDTPDGDALISAALGLSENAARRAFSSSLASDDPVAVVLEEKRRLVRDSSALEIIDTDIAYEDVGGLEGLKRWLSERERAFSPEARAFGLPIPKGVLLLGVQGCGKSISAKAVASHWRLPLMRMDLAAIFGGGVPAERALKRATGLAESLAPAVLWIDEIEKGFAGADTESPSAVAEVSRVLGAFTTWLQEKQAPVFVVATANEVKSLPPELLRRGRFDEVFFVDLPDARAREEILAVHLKRRKRDPTAFQLRAISSSTEHFSGSELEQVVVSALYRAFRSSRELEVADLERAAADTVPLFRTYEERVKALRAWAKNRARPAGRAEGIIDILRGGST